MTFQQPQITINISNSDVACCSVVHFCRYWILSPSRWFYLIPLFQGLPELCVVSVDVLN